MIQTITTKYVSYRIYVKSGINIVLIGKKKTKEKAEEVLNLLKFHGLKEDSVFILEKEREVRHHYELD